MGYGRRLVGQLGNRTAAKEPVTAPARLHLFDKLRFQAHGAEAVDLAVDVVIAVDQTDVLHLGADLDHAARTFQLQILDDRDRIAILQDIADGVAVNLGAVAGIGCRLLRPFMGALRADVEAAVFVGEFGIAFGAGWQSVHVLVFRDKAGAVKKGQYTTSRRACRLFHL